MGDRQISDELAMQRIHELLDGTEWSADTAPSVADIVRLTGREIREPDELECGACGAEAGEDCRPGCTGQAAHLDETGPREADCPECDGHGVIPCGECANGDECSKCGGTGRRTVA